MARGIPLVIGGALLALIVGPVGGIALYYSLPDHPKVATIAAIAAQAAGGALIVVGAVRNSRRNRQLAPPPISN